MNMMPVLCPLDRIEPNPYQPRDGEDPQHVENIATSIRAIGGLLQYPVGRLIIVTDDGPMTAPEELYALDNWDAVRSIEPYANIELAFGHTRLAAFRLLAKKEGTTLSQMPIVLRRLNDEDMFEYAIRENIDRDALTPIELGRAMQTYRDVFGKTSAQIGALFGLSDSAVRNKMRLLSLPEAVQDKLSSGELPEAAARSLLAVQRVAPERVTELASEITNGGRSTPEQVATVIDRTLASRDGIVSMWSHYHKGTPSGGPGLFPLTWVTTGVDGMPARKISEYLAAQWKENAQLDDGNSFLMHVGDIVDAIDKGQPTSSWPEMLVEQVATLRYPPACTACPFYAVNGGNHYCGLKPCHQAKKQAWMQAELARISESLEIPVYDPKTDGKVYETCARWGSNKKKFEQWFAVKADHLRVRAHYDNYSADGFTNSQCVQLISVNADYRKEIEGKKAKAAEEKAAGVTELERQQAEQKRREESKEFLVEVAAPVFAQAFSMLSQGVLHGLMQAISRWNASENADEMLTKLTYDVLRQYFEWSDITAGPTLIATKLIPIAQAWEIELPQNWAEYTE